jgi:hypothetical protein
VSQEFWFFDKIKALLELGEACTQEMYVDVCKQGPILNENFQYPYSATLQGIVY